MLQQMTAFYIRKKFAWVSEWLLFNANSAIFQLYHGENKKIFNEMIDQHSQRIDISPHSDALSLFWTN